MLSAKIINILNRPSLKPAIIKSFLSLHSFIQKAPTVQERKKKIKTCRLVENSRAVRIAKAMEKNSAISNPRKKQMVIAPAGSGMPMNMDTEDMSDESPLLTELAAGREDLPWELKILQLKGR